VSRPTPPAQAIAAGAVMACIATAADSAGLGFVKFSGAGALPPGVPEIRIALPPVQVLMVAAQRRLAAQ
jgi:hypothetical protein